MNVYTRMLLTSGCVLAVLVAGCAGDSGLAVRSTETSGAPIPIDAGTDAGGVATAQGELLGDLDNDNNPSVGDAIGILRIVVGLSPDNHLADVDQNGATGVDDAIAVLRCVVQLAQWPIGVFSNPSLSYFTSQSFNPEHQRTALVRGNYWMDSDTWSGFSTVYEAEGLNVGSVHGGVIDGRLYLFFDRRWPGGGFNDIGYIRSGDLYSTSWSAFQRVECGLEVYGAHGHLIHVEGTDSWLQPYYGWSNVDGTWVYYVKVFRTDDRGATWYDGGVVYEGDCMFVEPSGVCLGPDQVMILVRNQFGGSISRFRSFDGGHTWTAREDTGRNKSTCIPDIEYDGVGSVLLAYLDRGTMELELAWATGADAWEDSHAYSRNTTKPSCNPGYPTVCALGPNEFYVVHSEETDASGVDCDTVGGRVTVPLSANPFAGFRKVVDTPYKEAYGVLLDVRGTQ